ncbi:hypothetical protein [Streptomyces sp. NPDC004528]|uniref:DUF7169 domain-containing protein n=1 Tax=Streptomyces sp. NPDC004528 TaxID=3154550 RepID=UPI0033A822A2
MTYSPSQVADGQHLIALVTALTRDLDELRHYVSVYDDAVTMPGRRPDVDADGTGRQATHGPSRPTEDTVLDERREGLQTELNNGAYWLTRATAMVRGVVASMDRALSSWEGESIAAGGPHLIIVTGPQTTSDEREDLAELAGRLDAHTATCPDVRWADVTEMVALDGWELCPASVADVTIAESLGVPVHRFVP